MHVVMFVEVTLPLGGEGAEEAGVLLQAHQLVHRRRIVQTSQPDTPGLVLTNSYLCSVENVCYLNKIPCVVDFLFVFFIYRVTSYT